MWTRALAVALVSALLLGSRSDAQNLIKNGDFESGFSSQYAYDSSVFGAGTYAIGTDPHNLRGDVASFGDHTSGTGNMLVANASTVAGTAVWTTTVTVAPQTQYTFGIWCASWGPAGGADPSPARLQLFVNGSKVGAEFQPIAQVGQWTGFQRSWTSDTAQTVSLAVVDANLEGDNGNDFALDDISFVGAGTDLIPDGSDFKLAFDSQYLRTSSLFEQGTYNLAFDPHDYHAGGASFHDHTTGHGLMFAANGAPSAGVAAWQQSVAVEQNRRYTFIAWTASWGLLNGSDPNPAVLRLYINGAPVGADLTLPKEDGLWTRWRVVWDSGSATTATLEIVDQNTVYDGNDFALDDLSFRPYSSADLTGDAVPDLLLQSLSDHRMALLTLNGTTVTSSSSLYPVLPLNWNVVGVGDFNGDQTNEIVVQNSATREVSLLFLNGKVVQSSIPVNPTLPANWQVVAVGDIDGDLRADLICQNVSTQQIAVLFMNGSTIKLSKSFSQRLLPDWRVIGAADFNGDGNCDLVVQNGSTREISILTLNGTTITGSIPLDPTLPPNWIVGAVGDYNGDGKPDLVVQNPLTRQISILTTSNLKITASIPVNPTAQDGWMVAGPK